MSRGPGRWQSLLLERLASSDGFVVLFEIEEALDSAPTRAEYSAINRAARRLVEAGKAERWYVWIGDVNDVRKPALWLQRPGLPRPEHLAGTRYATDPVNVEGISNPVPTTVTQESETLRNVTLGDNRNVYPNGYPGSRPWWRARSGHKTGCVICGSDLPANIGYSTYKRVASHRMFCSNACRQKAYREVRRLGVAR